MVWEGLEMGSVTQKAIDKPQALISVASTAAFARCPITGLAKAT